MSVNEPGLDLQEWETRWAEIEEALAEDPATELPLACDEVERLLAVDEGDDVLHSQQSELETSYGAARDVANRLEAGEDVDPGDIGAAIEDLRAIRNAILPAGGAA
jgi:hypothetical protein